LVLAGAAVEFNDTANEKKRAEFEVSFKTGPGPTIWRPCLNIKNRPLIKNTILKKNKTILHINCK
jgi:hypothetical protein